MADKYLTLVGDDGQLTEVEATVVSTGVGSAGDIIALDAEGKLDSSIVAGEASGSVPLVSDSNLLAGAFVHVYDNSGTPTITAADADTGKVAHGFLREDVNIGEETTLFTQGINIFVTGLTPGLTYFIGNAGAVSLTPPSIAGSVVQIIGKAVAADKVIFDPVQPVIRS